VCEGSQALLQAPGATRLSVVDIKAVFAKKRYNYDTVSYELSP